MLLSVTKPPNPQVLVQPLHVPGAVAPERCSVNAFLWLSNHQKPQEAKQRFGACRECRSGAWDEMHTYAVFN